MELVANVWPVVDSGTNMVQRFFVRAYAIEASDKIIGLTLKALSVSDFRMASVFKIPDRFKVVYEGGILSGVLSIQMFHDHLQELLEPAYRQLEGGSAQLQGINVSKGDAQINSVVVVPRFPNDPYTVTTTLLETEAGELIAQLHQ